MNCTEVEELSGAFALGALPDDERVAVLAHLESCDKHPDMQELLAVAASLALAVPEIEPPAALKTRLMDAVRAEAPAARRAPVAAPAPRRGFADTVRGWFANPRLGYGLASALAVLVVGLVAWNVTLQGNDSDRKVMQMHGQVSGQVIYLPDEKLAVMNVTGLDPLPTGKVYQVWGMTDTLATPLGLLQMSPSGEVTTSMQFDGDAFTQLGVTVEDAPGAAAPTSAPVFTADFT